MRLLKIRLFSKIFQSLQRVPSVFDIFSKTEWLLTNLEEPPFTVFGIARFFKISRFCLKIRFSQAQHSISDLFSKTGVFSMRFFKIGFHRSPPQFLLETKRFASIKDYSRFSATYRRPSSIFFFRKNSSIFCFLKSFRKCLRSTASPLCL